MKEKLIIVMGVIVGSLISSNAIAGSVTLYSYSQCQGAPILNITPTSNNKDGCSPFSLATVWSSDLNVARPIVAGLDSSVVLKTSSTQTCAYIFRSGTAKGCTVTLDKNASGTLYVTMSNSNKAHTLDCVCNSASFVSS